jgi:phospholipase/carboxylesterase
MRIETFGELECVVTGGPDGRGGGDGPVVVLLHGFGAPGTDLVGIARAVDVTRETRFVFPAAPMRLPPMFGEGRAWWMIDLAALDRAIARGELRNLANEDPAELPAARAKVTAMLDAVTDRLAPPPGALVLGGFSQGAMLACDVALSEPARPLAGLVLFSGTLLAEARWRTLFGARAGLRVLQSHGHADPLLPFEMAERLRDGLVEGGASVEFLAFPGGHDIPRPVLARLGAFVRAQASSALA